ncbi:MAG: cysteine desulfurase family protein [Clostridia bacterium]|nr:cysteine desulfurase family protein [Clostridia bacterium]
MDKREVYLDNSATTKLDEDVLEAMMPYFTEYYGNSLSQYGFSRKCAQAVDDARYSVAKAIDCKPVEVYFTSCGSEANSWAVRGGALSGRKRGSHVILSKIEHPSIMNSGKWLTQNGFDVTYLDVDKYGMVHEDELRKAIREDTVLISIMLANNEIGTIQNIPALAAIAHANGIVFHTDCVQAMGLIDVNVKKLGVDMLTISAHKFYGPKGVGVLYVRSGLIIDRLINGGGQERGMRGGTTNTPLIVGMGVAIEKAVTETDTNAAKITLMRDRMIERIKNEIPDVILNGHPRQRLPSNVNFAFNYIEGESILMRLDLEGIAVSSGSACSSGSLEPSHVLLATGLPVERAHGSIRFSIGKHNTMEDIDYTVDKLKVIIAQLREMSPLYKPQDRVKEV